MKATSKLILTVVLLWAVTGVAHQQTERYIPIGYSPGLTDTVSGIVRSNRGSYLSIEGEKIAVDDHTPVWIDRSLLGRTSLVGDREDCKPGHYVEVRYHQMDGENVAEWIKVRGD